MSKSSLKSLTIQNITTPPKHIEFFKKNIKISFKTFYIQYNYIFHKFNKSLNFTIFHQPEHEYFYSNEPFKLYKNIQFDKKSFYINRIFFKRNQHLKHFINFIFSIKKINFFFFFKQSDSFKKKKIFLNKKKFTNKKKFPNKKKFTLIKC